MGMKYQIEFFLKLSTIMTMCERNDLHKVRTDGTCLKYLTRHAATHVQLLK